MKTLRITTALLLTTALWAQKETANTPVVEWTRVGKVITEHDRFRGQTITQTTLKMPLIALDEAKQRFGATGKEARELIEATDELSSSCFDMKSKNHILLTAVRVVTEDVQEVCLEIEVMNPDGASKPDAHATDWILVDENPTEVAMLRRIRREVWSDTRLGPLPAAKKSIELRVGDCDFKINGDALRALQPNSLDGKSEGSPEAELGPPR